VSRCDVHILISPGRQQWLSQCLASLDREPAMIRIRRGTPGHIGIGRASAYAEGSAPFVARVDDDDYIEPGALATCVALLDANPNASAATTDLAIVDRSERITGHTRIRDRSVAAIARSPATVHHLTVYRRAAVEPWLDEIAAWPYWDDWILAAGVATWGPVLSVPMMGYYWRRHRTRAETMALFQPQRESYRAAARRVREILR